MSALLGGLMIMIGAMWFVGLGMFTMVGQHGRYMTLTRSALGLIFDQICRFSRWAWARYRQQIIWFAIGVVFGLLIAQPR
jgi:hypothetical protein